MTWADHLTRQAAIRAALGRGDSVNPADLPVDLVIALHDLADECEWED